MVWYCMSNIKFDRNLLTVLIVSNFSSNLSYLFENFNSYDPLMIQKACQDQRPYDRKKPLRQDPKISVCTDIM